VVDHSVFDELRQLPTRDHMADPPTMEELIKAINQMKNHKAHTHTHTQHTTILRLSGFCPGQPG